MQQTNSEIKVQLKFGGLTASLIILSNVPAHFRFSYVLKSLIIFKCCKSKMLQVGFFFPVSLIVGSSASVVYGIRQVKYFLFCALIYFNQLSLRKKKTHPLKFMSLLSKGDKITSWFCQRGTRLQVEDQMNDWGTYFRCTRVWPPTLWRKELRREKGGLWSW